MHPVTGLLIAYLSGSIPFAYLAGRIFKGIDLRQHGSGNLGATNVYRLLGWRVALVVLLLDAAKGAVPVLLLPDLVADEGRRMLGDYSWGWAIAFGVAAIAGHVRSVFLLWRGGGKGVATAAGVFFALALTPMIVTAIVWTGVVFATGYVSLASIVAALVLPVALAIIEGLDSPLLPVSGIVAVFVIWTHRANIARLRRGEENRFGKRRAEAPTAAVAGTTTDERIGQRAGSSLGKAGREARDVSGAQDPQVDR